MLYAAQKVLLAARISLLLLGSTSDPAASICRRSGVIPFGATRMGAVRVASRAAARGFVNPPRELLFHLPVRGPRTR